MMDSATGTGKGTKQNPRVVHDWCQAFDTCREQNRPMWFKVVAEVGKCFPSGRFEAVTNEPHDIEGCGTGIDCDGRSLVR